MSNNSPAETLVATPHKVVGENVLTGNTWSMGFEPFADYGHVPEVYPSKEDALDVAREYRRLESARNIEYRVAAVETESVRSVEGRYGVRYVEVKT
jgi:hypothetical protein